MTLTAKIKACDRCKFLYGEDELVGDAWGQLVCTRCFVKYTDGK